MSIFADGERVDVIGTSRGKGFQGVVKRHHFAGGARDARLDVPPRARVDRRLVVSRRASSRACAMAGHMGDDRVTTRNLQGACRWTPRTTCCSSRARCRAGRTAIVVIRKAVAAKPIKVAQVEPAKKKGKK